MGRSQVYDLQYYFELGKSIGSTGSPLFEEEGARGWQVQAMRNGHRAGVAAKMAFDNKQKGYAVRDVPLGGMAKKFPDLCHIEHPNAKRDCGCGFGQCAKGLIL